MAQLPRQEGDEEKPATGPAFGLQGQPSSHHATAGERERRLPKNAPSGARMMGSMMDRDGGCHVRPRVSKGFGAELGGGSSAIAELRPRMRPTTLRPVFVAEMQPARFKGRLLKVSISWAASARRAGLQPAGEARLGET
jgi:hypothetical protein